MRADGPSTIVARLRDLGYPPGSKYADYLASEHWQEVKRRYANSAVPQRCACGKQRHALHHKTYVRLGCEELTDLQPVCRACHALLHERSTRTTRPTTPKPAPDRKPKKQGKRRKPKRRPRSNTRHWRTQNGTYPVHIRYVEPEPKRDA